jgi:hypothetical protein
MGRDELLLGQDGAEMGGYFSFCGYWRTGVRTIFQSQYSCRLSVADSSVSAFGRALLFPKDITEIFQCRRIWLRVALSGADMVAWGMAGDTAFNTLFIGLVQSAELRSFVALGALCFGVIAVFAAQCD